MPFPILHQDTSLIAVNKPEGVAAVPEHAQDPDCLLEQLIRQLGCRLLPVHRLDKDVSGVILYACHADSHRFLNTAFSEHRVRKTYLALVHGNVVPACGTIDQPIREFGSGRMGVSPTGKPSTTDFRVLQRFDNVTLVEAAPRTGRRHQIRVHLYHLGHPIVGDRRYGQRAVQEQFPRLMLHALSIELPHPNGRPFALRDCPSASFHAELARLTGHGQP
jgi:RluA family pseudouridine synthase